MDIPEDAIEFVKTHSGVEAAVMHVGLNNTQVVLVSEEGDWLRFVVLDHLAAERLCKLLKIEMHDGYTDAMRQAMGNFRRTPADWSEAPYPERYRSSST